MQGQSYRTKTFKQLYRTNECDFICPGRSFPSQGQSASSPQVSRYGDWPDESGLFI